MKVSEINIQQPEKNFLNNSAKINLLTQYMYAHKRLILLDYDGTLVPFASKPQDAVPNEELYDILKRLIADPENTVYIISGRDSVTLEKWLGMLNLNIIAEHGAKIKDKEKGWINVAPEGAVWKEKVLPIMEAYCQNCPNTFIEHKDFSLAWHYRNAEPVQARLDAKQLIKTVEEIAATEAIQLLDGNKVVEVRNMGINKGSAVAEVTQKISADFILAVGDDTTDEDMFLQLVDTPHAYTIKVGNEPSYAKYNLYTPYMIRSLLQMMGEIKK